MAGEPGDLGSRTGDERGCPHPWFAMPLNTVGTTGSDPWKYGLILPMEPNQTLRPYKPQPKDALAYQLRLLSSGLRNPLIRTGHPSSEIRTNHHVCPGETVAPRFLVGLLRNIYPSASAHPRSPVTARSPHAHALRLAYLAPFLGVVLSVIHISTV